MATGDISAQVWKNCRGQWMIGTAGEKKSEKPVLLVQLDDDDGNDINIQIAIQSFLCRGKFQLQPHTY